MGSLCNPFEVKTSHQVSHDDDRTKGGLDSQIKIIPARLSKN